MVDDLVDHVHEEGGEKFNHQTAHDVSPQLHRHLEAVFTKRGFGMKCHLHAFFPIWQHMLVHLPSEHLVKSNRGGTLFVDIDFFWNQSCQFVVLSLKVEHKEAFLLVKRILVSVWKWTGKDGLIVCCQDQKIFTSLVSFVRTETFHPTGHFSLSLFLQFQVFFHYDAVSVLLSLDSDFRFPDPCIFHFDVVCRIL